MNPLLADFADVIGLIVTLAIVGFSVLSKFLGDNAPKRPPQGAPPPRQQNKNPQAQSIESEIEEFLRQSRGGGRAPVEVEVLEEVEAEKTPATLTQSASAFDTEPVEEVITPGQGYGQELSQHVQSHIGRDSISTRDAHLGDVVEEADERIEHHLEEVFDHQVGSLKHVDSTTSTSKIAEGTDASSWEETDEKSSPIAEDLIKMMKSPDSVRKLFIAKEIFERPEI